MTKEITVAHSPDADDAFMFYALANNLLDTQGLTVHQELKDIQSLNKDAMNGKYEVSAISFAAYPYVQDKYKLMPVGASMGNNYGPVVISKNKMTAEDLKTCSLAIPGEMTTAYLALRLFEDDLNYAKIQAVPFDQIVDVVREGKFDAGVIIHESQLTYEQEGVHKVVDLGEWWTTLTGLPLPLGGNVVRKDLDEKTIALATKLMKETIEYSLAHREEALKYALQFARNLEGNTELADKFVGMYVNELTVDYGEAGRKALTKLFEMANEKGLYAKPVRPEFVIPETVTV